MTGKDIVPFVKALQSVFSTMLSLHVEIGEPGMRPENDPDADVSGIISISGDLKGAVVMSFPKETAEALASIFTGMQLNTDNDDFADAIGELANMVTGNAKAELTGHKLSIGCPSVIIGKGHRVLSQKEQPIIRIPCQCECGPFAVEVSMVEVAVPAAVQA